MLEFIFAEKGLVEMFSSMGRFTDGIGLLEIPLSYRRAFRALLFDQSGLKLLRSIYRHHIQLGKYLYGQLLDKRAGKPKELWDAPNKQI